MQNFSEEVFLYDYQVKLINKIYFDIDDLYKKYCLREIDKKLTSYKSQDINKNRYNKENITLEETIEKLVSCT